MTAKQEKEKKLKAALTTVAVNVLILLVMIFAAAWQSPGSGPGDYPGIEVNLGYDDQGTGDIEPKTPIGTEEAKDKENPSTKVEDQQPQQQASSPQQTQEEDKKIIEPTTLTDPNSDVEIKEEKKEVKPEEKPVEKKPIEKKETPVEKKVEEKPKVNPNAVYQGKKTATDKATEGNGTGKEGTPGNQGDDVGKEGNKGVPGGTEGAAVYKGTPGGGNGGPVLDLFGWNWDFIPKADVPANENPGKIVFTIVVDENGELESYHKESSTLSPAAEKSCVEALQKLTFTKKSGAKVPAKTKGTITFVVVAK